MTPTDIPRVTRADNDDRPTAVVRAEAGAQAWRAVVHAQQHATPEHTDFYALAGELVDTLRSLDALAGLLARLTAGYGADRVLYDDEDAKPAHRLRSAVLAMAETRHGLAQAERAANRFWSAIGHIGTRYHHDAQHDAYDNDGGDRS